MECLGDWGLRDKLLELFSIEPFPRLQHFAISNPSTFLQLTTPALEQLRIKNCVGVPEVRMDGITVLHLDTYLLSYDSLCDILLRCPALTVLALYDKCGRRPFWPQILPINVISLPNLHSLQLYAASSSISGKLLFINAPNLDDLIIAPVGHKDLISFFARWGPYRKFPLLKSLTVTLAEPIDYDFLPLAFKAFPAVENLTLPNVYDEQFSRMFAALLVDGEIIWPRLRTLALRGIDRLTEDAVLQMVRFRKNQGYPLDTLYLDYDSLRMYSLSSLVRQLVVKERDVWEIRRREAMYSEFPKRFDSLGKTWELE
jgi:hypothetical protein